MYNPADVIRLSQYLQEHPKKNLIFDFDDTLVTLQLPWDVYARGIKAILNEIDPNLVARYPGSETKYLIHEALIKHGQPIQQRINHFRRQFEKDCLQGVICNDWMLTFLRENAANYQFFIWSSNEAQTILPILQNYHLESLFKQVVGASDVMYPKPSPDGFYVLFDPSTQKKADFLFIGDSSSDEEASRKAGIDFFRTQKP